MYSFKNKRVFITGGTAGIGYGIAEALLRYPIQAIGVCSSNQDNVDKARDFLEINNINNIDVDAFVCDVLNENDMFDTVAKFKPDILITSAGVNSCDYFENLKNDDFIRHFQVDTLGVLNSVRGALPHMKQSGGTIVNISSLLSTTPLIGYSAFCAGKGAIQLALESLQSEYASDKILFQHVLAPAVKTKMLQDEKGIAEIDHLFGEEDDHDCLPEEFARYVIKGIKKRRKYITYDRNIAYAAINLFFNCNKAPDSIYEFLVNTLFIIPCYWMICIKKFFLNYTVNRFRKKNQGQNESHTVVYPE